MPDLGEDRTAFLVHGIGDQFPAGDLLRRPDAGHADVALPLGRHRRAFGHDQAGAGTPGVATPGVATQPQPAAVPAASESIEDRLAKLKGLLDKGLISQGDYDSTKAELLKKLIG